MEKRAQRVLKSIFLVVFMAIGLTASAQENSNTLDEIYVPSENSIFNQEDSKGNGSESGGNDYKHLISFNPLLLTRGIAAVQYQFFVKETIGFHAGFGNSFGKDYIMAIGTFSDASEFFDSEDTDVSLLSLMVDGKFVPGPNLFFNSGITFYYDSFWGYSTSFFSLEYRYSNVNLEYELRDYNSTTGSTDVKNFDIDTRSNLATFLFGIENNSGGDVAMFHKFYWGFGLRKTSFDEIDYSSEVSIFGTSSEQEYKLTGDRASQYSFSLHLGYTFGIGW